MSVKVKAYLKRSIGENTDQKYEIRRFNIDQDVSTSYEYLIGKLATVYSGVNRRNFRLYWKDGEGDDVTFSSDEELIDALSSVEDGVFKVYIEICENATRDKEVKGMIHEGVVCDGCEGPIQGVRFKCKVCPDYDLCEKCKLSGLHAEHNMKEIKKPCKRPPPPPLFHLPHFPPFHHRIPQPHFGPQCYQGGTGFPFQGGMIPRPYSEGFPNCQTDERKCMRNSWKRYWRSFHENPEGKKRCKREGMCQEKETSEEPETKNCSSSSSEEDKRAAPPNPEHARFDWMWPLFSLEVGVDHGNNQFRCHKSGGRCQRKGKQCASTTEKAANTETVAEEKMDEAKVPDKVAEAPPASMDSTKENESDWTLIKDDDGLDNGVKESVEGIQKIQINESGDQDIVTSLSQMHSMGFYDDGKGGSLYELMVKVKGDVENAIEEINLNKG